MKKTNKNTVYKFDARYVNNGIIVNFYCTNSTDVTLVFRTTKSLAKYITNLVTKGKN